MPPIRTSHDTPGVSSAGIRKKMRKGTHSCFECRRRKIRCVFSPDNSTTCTECFARGSRCVDQEHVDADVIVDHRKNLRERVAKLESLVESLLEDRPSSRTAKLFRKLESQGSPQSSTPQSPEDPQSATDKVHDGPPMMSLFSNDVLSRVAGQMEGSDVQSESGPTPKSDVQSPTTYNLAYRGWEDQLPSIESDKMPSPSAIKTQRTKQALLQALPPLDELVPLLTKDDKWWVLFGQKCPGTRGKTTIEEFARRVVTSGSVCELGTLVLSYGSVTDSKFEQCLTLVDRWVLSDDEHMGTIEGLECAVLQCKLYADIGQVRRSWLTCRRAIGMAQLMGLHRTHSTSLVHGSIWWMLYVADRLTSLMLGMPYAVSDNHVNMNIAGIPLDQCYDQSTFMRHCAVFAGKVIDLNQSVQVSNYSAAQKLDQDMNAFANKMSPEYWHIDPLPKSADTNSTLEWQDRILGQICFHQTRVYLHMPFMLKSTTNPQYDHSRQVCFGAAREMLRLYHVLRADGTPIYECKAIDFVGFTAAIVIVLGLLGYGRLAQNHDPQSDERDWNLVEHSTEIFKKASTEPGGKVAEQSYKALQTLSAVRNYSIEGASQESDPNDHAKIAIPFFGTITIKRGERFKHISPSPNAIVCAKGSPIPIQSPTSQASPSASSPSLRHTLSTATSRSNSPHMGTMGHPTNAPHRSASQPKSHASQYLGVIPQSKQPLNNYNSFTNDPFVAYDGFLALPDFTLDPGNSSIGSNSSQATHGSQIPTVQTPFSFPTSAFEGSPLLNYKGQLPQHNLGMHQQAQQPFTSGPFGSGFSWTENVGNMDVDQDWSWVLNGGDGNPQAGYA